MLQNWNNYMDGNLHKQPKHVKRALQDLVDIIIAVDCFVFWQ